MNSPPDPKRSHHATLRHFSASLPMLLLRAREAVMQRFRRMLRANGLTEQQWRVLRSLDTVVPRELSVLATTTFLLAPSLSRILPDLTAQSLVLVETDERDQRRKLVRLTPQGEALIAGIAPLSEAIYADITERFGADHLDRLQSLLVQLEADLASDPAASARGRKARRVPKDGAGQESEKRLTR